MSAPEGKTVSPPPGSDHPSSQPFAMKPIYRYLLFFLLLLPAIALRDYTPDNELRYISLVNEALQNGTWFTFYDHGTVYADKPPLYFWYIALMHFLLGAHHMWAIALASLLPAIGIIALMDRWMREESVPCDTALAGSMLMITAMYIGTALVLRMDMLMALFILLALRAFYRLYQGKASRSTRWMIPVYIFLAIFTKGPVGFLMPMVSIVAFLAIKKDLRHFGRYFGWEQWGVLIGLCVLWFSAVYAEGGSEYLNNILFKQTVGRGVNSFHHAEPFYYYLTHFVYALAPWSLLYLVSYVKGVKARLWKTDLEKFLVAVSASTFVMLSLVSSKLDIYLVPAYPFMVYLSAIWIARTGASKWYSAAAALPCLVFALALPAVAVLGDKLPFGLGESLPTYLCAGVLSLSGIAALVLIFRTRMACGIKTAAIGFLAAVFLGSWAIPQVNPHIGFKYLGARACQIAQQHGIEHFAYYNFDEGWYMDTFTGESFHRIHNMDELDSLESLPEPSLLLVRQTEARHDSAFTAHIRDWKPAEEKGSYRLFVIEGKKETGGDALPPRSGQEP